MNELPLYTTGKSREQRLCRATVEDLERANAGYVRAQRGFSAPVLCQATWTKRTAPWLKKERARIAAELEANKRGTK